MKLHRALRYAQTAADRTLAPAFVFNAAHRANLDAAPEGDEAWFITVDGPPDPSGFDCYTVVPR
jgi:hypothetical protein